MKREISVFLRCFINSYYEEIVILSETIQALFLIYLVRSVDIWVILYYNGKKGSYEEYTWKRIILLLTVLSWEDIKKQSKGA